MFNIHIEIERWKFNKQHNLYVSNMGNFKDKNKEDIKLTIERGGYLTVPVCNNKQGKVKYLFAHRIVMETWCPRANMWRDKLTVDHLDHNKRNNTYKNLEWVSNKENLRRATADMVYDDKDALVQQLQNKVKMLEMELERFSSDKLKITAVGIKNFNSWNEVKEFLISKNQNYRNANNKTMEKAILKAYHNGNKYCGYHWKVLNY